MIFFFYLIIAFWTFLLRKLMIICWGLLPVCFFSIGPVSQQNLSMSLADTFCIYFSKISISQIFFSLFFKQWIRKPFVLEYCSWWSILLSIVYTFSFKVFSSFFSSGICLIYQKFNNFLHVPSTLNLSFFCWERKFKNLVYLLFQVLQAVV